MDARRNAADHLKIMPPDSLETGMQKKMECKAGSADETAAALAAVRISSSCPTQQSAFYAPREPI